jgi:hypothetical protein
MDGRGTGIARHADDSGQEPKFDLVPSPAETGHLLGLRPFRTLWKHRNPHGCCIVLCRNCFARKAPHYDGRHGTQETHDGG